MPNTDRGHRESAAPEAAAAVVALAVVSVARLVPDGPVQLLSTLADLGVAAAVTAVVALSVSLLMREVRPAAQFGVTLAGCLAILAVICAIALAIVTAPGREARHEAASGEQVGIPNRDVRTRIKSAAGSEYGVGWGEADDDVIRIHTSSERSGMITWFPTEDPGAHFYAEVEARRVDGPADTACVLLFGYRDERWWYGLRLHAGGEAHLARFEGEIPARSFEGPTQLSYATNLDTWNRLAVLREGRQVTMFVNDRRVFEREFDENEDLGGGVTFGTLDIADNYRGDMECEFRHEEVFRLDGP